MRTVPDEYRDDPGFISAAEAAGSTDFIDLLHIGGRWVARVKFSADTNVYYVVKGPTPGVALSRLARAARYMRDNPVCEGDFPKVLRDIKEEEKRDGRRSPVQ